MAWGKPKRNGKCQLCGRGGACSCQRRLNAAANTRPQDQPRPCTSMCGRTKGKACGATVRSGKCPCAFC